MKQKWNFFHKQDTFFSNIKLKFNIERWTKNCSVQWNGSCSVLQMKRNCTACNMKIDSNSYKKDRTVCKDC